MTEDKLKPLRATIQRAGMRDGEWTITLSIPAADGAKAAILALYTGIVFLVTFKPEAAAEPKDPAI